MRTSILYHRNDTALAGTRVSRHTHDFWQIEWIGCGQAEFSLESGDRKITAGQSLLIAPGKKHGIRYPEQTEYLSIKFVLANESDALPGLVGGLGDAYFSRIMGTLHDLLPKGEFLPHATRARTERLLDGLLSGLDDTVALSENEKAKKHSLQPAARVFALLDASAIPPRSVKMLARQLGYTPNYLASTFLKRTGTSLKRILDRESHRRACALLAYSEKSIGEIAEELDYPDIFGFSRFFKRMSGVSPKSYRSTVSTNRKILPHTPDACCSGCRGYTPATRRRNRGSRDYRQAGF